MNIGNITSDNFNLDSNGKDIQIEVYEQLIEQLQQENKQLKEKLDKYENPEDMTLYSMWCTEKVKEENQKLQTIANNCKQLKDNWNKLKEYIKETKLKEFEKSYGKRYGKTFTQAEIIVCNMILDKMQELAKGDSNE